MKLKAIHVITIGAVVAVGGGIVAYLVGAGFDYGVPSKVVFAGFFPSELEPDSARWDMSTTDVRPGYYVRFRASNFTTSVSPGGPYQTYSLLDPNLAAVFLTKEFTVEETLNYTSTYVVYQTDPNYVPDVPAARTLVDTGVRRKSCGPDKKSDQTETAQFYIVPKIAQFPPKTPDTSSPRTPGS